MRIQKFHSRRGITLLFVLSMIILFLMMGTAFVVIANNYLKESKRRAKIRIKEVSGSSDLDRAFYELIRGPKMDDITSSLRGQSILADQYGYGFTARVADGPDKILKTGGQFFSLKLANFASVRPGGTAPTPATMIPGEYIGRLLSFVTGNAQGVTTRIVSHNGDTFVVMPVWQDDGDELNNINLTQTNRVVVNGRDFSGVGAGVYNPAAPTNQLSIDGLLPNLKWLPTSNPAFGRYLNNDGSTNEPYDAADYHNMFLSGIDANGEIIPSFHRQTLYNYMMANGYTSIPNQRRFSFRPIAGVASDGAGANFQYNGGPGSLDVDCDGDGRLDSVFIDTGSPVRTGPDGKRYKALVAYHVVDLDGRLNVNAHGRLAELPTYADTPNPMLGFAGVSPVGAGYGPPEITLSTIFTDPTDYARLLQWRYGFDGRPGGAPGNRALQKLFGYARGNMVVGGLFRGSPMDLHGRFFVGTPQNSPQFQDPHYGAIGGAIGFINTMPEINIRGSGLADEFLYSSYEMQFAPPPYRDVNDSPYRAAELERLLRPYDADANLLEPRLWNLPINSAWRPGGATSNDRNLVTTDSWEVPVPSQSVLQMLRARLLAGGLPVGMVDNHLSRMLSREMLMGLKFDINRPFGNGMDDDGDGSVDEQGEINIDQRNSPVMDFDNSGDGGVGDYENAQQVFATNLYVLTLLVCGDAPNIDLDGNGNPGQTADHLLYKQSIAQWAINVADYRDHDSRMSRFQFDINPFNSDGWNPTGPDGRVVWGMERPELLLTEAIAHHDRRTEDGATVGGEYDDGGGPGSGPDPHFDNRLRPETSAFFEVYAPWTQSSFNQVFDPALYDAAGVDLDRKVGNSPVWRIVVRRPEDNKLLRAVYFAQPGAGLAAELDNSGLPLNLENFYPSQQVASLLPGRHAVIGSAGPKNAAPFRTTFGRKVGVDETVGLQLNTTRHIILDPANGQVIRYEPPVGGAGGGTTTVDSCVVAVIDTPRSLSLSDPTGGYPTVDAAGANATPVDDGLAYNGAPYDEPLDFSSADANRSAADLGFILYDGLGEHFRELQLQRLADPSRPWNNVNNPYLTIDRLSVDLMAFNGLKEQSTSEPDNNAAPITDGESDFSTRERGRRTTVSNRQKRLLWNRWANRNGLNENELAGDNHYFSFEFVDSLGQTNDAFQPTVATNSIASPPYAWLNWNNRPYANHLEIMNVPFTAPDQIADEFMVHVSNPLDVANANPVKGFADPQFNHLLNFRLPETQLNRLMDFIEVPSRFRGTETFLNEQVFTGKNVAALGGALQFAFNPPFHEVPSYRYPGKINLNTIYNAKVWNGLMAGRQSTVPFSKFQNDRKGNPGSVPTDFENVYRPGHAGTLVPIPALVKTPLQCGLLRDDPTSTTTPKTGLYSKNSGSQVYADINRNILFRDDPLQRLADITTCRSSVFAIWITVAYFEVDQNNLLGAEVGSETGEAVRHRGFYIFDRSIPMAFEPGHNHNVDRGILVKTIIE